MQDKSELRKKLRIARREHVAALPDATRGLLFRHPPAPLLEMVPENAAIGLYRANPYEAPTGHYARFFYERGHTIALPRFANSNAPMHFAEWSDPFEESDLLVGAFSLMEPTGEAKSVTPEILIVPLVGFTERCERLGQGGGHYDRWLAEHPGAVTIGLAWDCQLVDELPLEEHDRRLNAIVTPTRFYGPFDA